ncbi:MAG: hypothetical protein ACI4TX_01835, partial [Christensenellales bacterium]
GTMVTTYYYKYVGGIVGAVANNIIYSEKFANVYNNNTINTGVVSPLSSTNMLTINSAVSLVGFDYEHLEEYSHLRVGGLVGLVGMINGTIPIKQVTSNSILENSFNKVIYKTATPNIEKANDIAVSTIKDISTLSNNANKEMAVPDGYTEGQNTYGNGYELLQMMGDGKAVVSEVYGTIAYEDWKRGSETIKGVKSQIFLMHTISNFEFESATSKTPNLRDIELTSVDLSSVGIFTKLNSVTYDCYLINDVKDLNILATLINYGYISNGAKGITFMIAKDINYNNASFIGIGSSENPFRGTIDGNTNTISNIKLDNNSEYVGFVNYASGAVIKNLALDNVVFNIEADDLALYVGVVAFASNTNLSKIAVTNVTVTNAKAGVNSFGVLGGYIFGTTSNSSVISMCYTSVNSINLNAGKNISAFVYSTSGQGVMISNCYSNVLNAVLSNGVSAKVYGLIAEATSTTNIVNSWTKLYSGSLADANLVAFNSAVKITKVYSSINKTSDNFKSSTFYTTNSNWSGSTNPWTVTSNWNLDYLPSAYPVLSWVDKVVIDEPDESTGFDGDRTFNITSATHLVNIAIQIRNGKIANGGDGKIFKLLNNIDFNNMIVINGNPVQSLGSYDVPFKGIFDGQNYKISNFTLTETAGKENDVSLGFFGRIDSAVVKNVTFDGLNITLNQTAESQGKAYLGAIAGICNVSTINKVTFKNINLTLKANENYSYFGGVVGYAESSKLVNNFFYGTLKASFVGNNVSPLRAGGLIGYIKAQNMHVENNFVRLEQQTSLPIDSVNNCGILVGYITKGVSFTQVINNYYQNFSKMTKIAGYGTVDESNKAGTENSIQDYI